MLNVNMDTGTLSLKEKDFAVKFLKAVRRRTQSQMRVEVQALEMYL